MSYLICKLSGRISGTSLVSISLSKIIFKVLIKNKKERLSYIAAKRKGNVYLFFEKWEIIRWNGIVNDVTALYWWNQHTVTVNFVYLS